MRNLILLTFTLVLFSCNNNQGSKIKELTFAAYPSDDMVQTTKYTVNFSKYLEKQLGIKIKYFIATDYTAVIEAMRTNKCQVCILGPFSYLLASQNAGAEAIVSMGKKSGGMYSYYSLLITNPNTGLHNMEDVKKNASKIHLTFSDPASTSGHLVPRAYLTSIGLDPDKSFASVAFASSHAASLLSVYSGNNELGAVASLSLKRLLDNKQIDSSRIIIVWRSEPLLTDPLCVKNTLPVELKEKIRKALINMEANDSATFRQYVKYTYKGDKMRDSLMFRATSDSAYNSLRVIARTVKSLNIK
jgi:phosphonate transport system substrate-binding protein